MGIGINIKSKVLEFFYDYKMYIGNSIDDVKNGFGIFYLRINNLKVFGKKENNIEIELLIIFYKKKIYRIIW